MRNSKRPLPTPPRPHHAPRPEPRAGARTPMNDVELMPFGFWTPRPVANTRAYYLRNVLHDYSDVKCVSILRNTVAAMGPESVILIDEMVVPNERASWRAMQIDITMMACLASRERSGRV
jgi:demethylsterigmatocystin 6-O-methyltransferase